MALKILGYSVFSQSLSGIEKILRSQLHSQNQKHKIVNCLNPHSYAMSKSDKEFRDALMESDILVPDGVGIVLASKLYKCKIKKRITGWDVFELTMSIANEERLNVFFLGGTQQTIEKIKAKARKQYPNIRMIEGYSPPFKEQFDQTDMLKICDNIAESRADIIFLGLSAPKQEKVAAKLALFCDASLLISIGAVFDFYVGNVKRSPKIFRQVGLEWLPRLLQQPKRLARRTFVSAPVFFFDAVKEVMSEVKK